MEQVLELAGHNSSINILHLRLIQMMAVTALVSK